LEIEPTNWEDRLASLIALAYVAKAYVYVVRVNVLMLMFMIISILMSPCEPGFTANFVYFDW
jgi:hypothetical protein